jgi:hypothetical protein
MTRRSSRLLLIFVLLLLLLAVLILLNRPAPQAPGERPEPDGRSASWDSAPKPEPKEITFHGCPPEGDGSDPELNIRKNRVDEGNYIPVPFDSIMQLTWPAGVERRKRRNWSDDERREVGRHEGIPVRVRGYLAGAKEEGKESPNCHEEGHEFRDFHLWLVAEPNDSRSASIVIEVTPRVRAVHDGWTLARIHSIVRRQLPVEIGGWLMLDPEHPDQVGKTRGTIWEIHPVTMMRVQEHGEWYNGDALP